MKRFIRLPLALLLLFTLCLAALFSCANPGTGPDGGPYDEEPPRLVSMEPKLGERDIQKLKRVVLVFSENVKLDNPSEKIIVSPPQEEVPDIKVSGRRVSVELVDTLRENTTYTIDFSDAIKDATEGNPLGQFTYYFSTGEDVDTMEVSGTVIDALTMEPIKGILVGLYEADSPDSVFTTRAFDRVARTDDMGRFAVKGVRRGRYRIYALKDLDGDFFFSRGEQLAFSSDTLATDCFPDVRFDTAWVDSLTWDSIATVPYTHFTPDDVVLRAFSEVTTDRSLLKLIREVPNHFTAYFTAPSSHVPTITLPAYPGAENVFLEDRNATNDTITYWILDKSVSTDDSLHIYFTYEATDDSTHQRLLRTDSLDVPPRLTNARINKQRAQEDEKWQKQMEKRHKRGDYDHDERPVEALRVKEEIPGTLPPDENLRFSLEEPIMRLDTAAVRLYLKEDSLLTPAPLRVESAGLSAFRVRGEWRSKQKYVVEVDSAAIEGFSGLVNRPIRREFRITSEEDVGSLFVTLSHADTASVVQLLQSGEKLVKQARIADGHADFFYLKPGDYYLRLFVDSNGNGLWDTGDYAERRQPEQVSYYPEQISVRANWDTDVTWDVTSVPPLQQKPSELRKTKEKGREKSSHEKNLEREKKRR